MRSKYEALTIPRGRSVHDHIDDVEHIFSAAGNVAVAPVPEADAEILETGIRAHSVVVRQKLRDRNLMLSFGESVAVEQHFVEIEVVWEVDVERPVVRGAPVDHVPAAILELHVPYALECQYSEASRLCTT